MQEYEIELKNVSKSFELKGDSLEVLNDVSLKIRKGELVCIVGPNGCGKTTLANLLAGFDSPQKGEIRINKKKIRKPQTNIAIIFQEFSLFPWMNVLDNIALPLEIRGMGKDERHVIAKKYLKLLGLEGFEHYFPFKLSGGMKQKTAIARALAADAKILVMDESFESLDYHTKIKMQNELISIGKKTGKTIVFISHDIDEAIYLADKIFIFSERPGHVKKVFSVDLRRPRDFSSRDFTEFRRKVLKNLDEKLL